MSLTVYANSVGYSQGYYIDQIPYKQWSSLENLKSNVNPAYCMKKSTIATKSGTYNTPAPITLKDFNIKLTQGTKIQKVIVHYSQQKFSVSRSQAAVTFPSFAGAKFTLLGTGISKTGEAVSAKYTAYTLEFTGVTAEQLMSNDFGLKIEYPRNNSTNTGRMCLGNVFLEIVSENPTLTLEAKTENNNLVVGDTVEVECIVNRESVTDYNPKIHIEIPSGLTFQNSSGHGSVTTTETANLYEWDSEFNNRNTNKIKLTLTCTSKGTHQINLQDTLTEVQATLKINVNDYTTTVSTTLNEKNVPIVSGSTVDYNVVVKTDNPLTRAVTLKVDLPSGISISNQTQLTNEFHLTDVSLSESNKVLTFEFTLNKEITIPFRITFLSSGYSSQVIYLDNKLQVTTPFLVQPNSYDKLGFTRLLIPSEYSESMGNKIEYVFATVCKYEIDTTIENIKDWKNNLRVGIYNDSSEYINDEDDFLKQVQWCDKITTKKWIGVSTTFKYKAENPLYLVFSHDYLGNPLYESIHFEFTQSTLVEKQYVGMYDDTNKYPVPLRALLNNNEYAKITMDKRTSTNPVIIYNWAGMESFKSQDISIRGLILNLLYNVTETVELQVTVSADGYDEIKGYRNITLESGSGTVTLGGKYDLFGLSPHDLRGKAGELTVELVVNNPYDHKVDIELSDVNFTVNYLVVAKGVYGFEVDGERSEEYGLFFYDMDYNQGTKNEIEEFHVTGSDVTVVNRMNIKPKEITIEFAIDDCEIQEALEVADDIITKLFTNKRNVLTNKPKEKYIIFDHMPDKRYWFVRKDQVDDKVDNGTYSAKVKLYIPKGTAEVIPAITTGSRGATNGLITIEPTIHLLNTIDGKTELSENYTEQSLLVTNDKIKNGDLITIYNETRKVTLKAKGSTDEIDITPSVDLNTTWFRVRGEYNFESSSSIITNVQFHDRR